jgi:hypothetical protein
MSMTTKNFMTQRNGQNSEARFDIVSDDVPSNTSGELKPAMDPAGNQPQDLGHGEWVNRVLSTDLAS